MQNLLPAPSCGNPPLSIPCSAGLRSDGIRTTLWIRSPKTGKQIDIGEPAINTVRPLLARVAKARSEGKSKTAFTRDELKALVALTESPSPKPITPTAPTTPTTAPQPEPAKDDRLVEIPPGTPPSCAVYINLRVLESRTSGYMVELPTDPRGQAFLPAKVVGLGMPTTRYNVLRFRLPIWLYQRVRNQL